MMRLENLDTRVATRFVEGAPLLALLMTAVAQVAVMAGFLLMLREIVALISSPIRITGLEAVGVAGGFVLANVIMALRTRRGWRAAFEPRAVAVVSAPDSTRLHQVAQDVATELDGTAVARGLHAGVLTGGRLLGFETELRPGADGELVIEVWHRLWGAEAILPDLSAAKWGWLDAVAGVVATVSARDDLPAGAQGLSGDA